MRASNIYGKVLTRRTEVSGPKPVPVPLCPSKSSGTGYGSNPGFRVERFTTNHMNHGISSVLCWYVHSSTHELQLTSRLVWIEQIESLMPPIVSKSDSSTKRWQTWKIVLATRINPVNTKLILSNIKTQGGPRSKHSPPQFNPLKTKRICFV
jgi:hypothetical protein